MSVIFEINRDFPYQVALSFDQIAMEVLAWLDERSFEWDMYVDMPTGAIRYCFRSAADATAFKRRFVHAAQRRIVGAGVVLEPHPASIQDRDGAGPLLRVSRRIFPFIQRVFADSAYAGEKVTTATLIAVEIVRKNNPRRWVVERFFAWIGRNRRLAKDFEASIESARAFLYAASVMLLVRRIARAS